MNPTVGQLADEIEESAYRLQGLTHGLKRWLSENSVTPKDPQECERLQREELLFLALVEGIEREAKALVDHSQGLLSSTNTMPDSVDQLIAQWEDEEHGQDAEEGPA